ncbi:MAG TPA: phage terminase large subunit [Pyrinomonadaceae bacterium]|jgi:predicted phage terminase large subunit-like protein
MELTLRLPRLHSGQRKIKREARRFNVVDCGRRFGKTILAEDVTIDPALDGLPVCYIAPTYKMMREVWRDLKRMLAPITKRKDEVEKRIELITGGYIDLWSLEAYDQIRGRKYARAVIDEAAKYRYLEEAWNEVIRWTLIDYRGDAWFFSTPRGFNYFYKLFLKGKDPKFPAWRSWQMPTSANPYLTRSELEEIKADVPSRFYRQEFLAEFDAGEGTIFRREWFKNVIERKKLPQDLRWCRYWDLAASTKTTADFTAALAVSAPDPNSGIIYFRDMIRDRWEFPDQQRIMKTNMLGERVSYGTQHGIEKALHGIAAVQTFLRDSELANVPLKGIDVDKDKLSRALPWAARAEQDKICLVAGTWIEPFLDEVCSFTGTEDDEHDDQIDTASGGVQMSSIKKQAKGAV